MAIIGQAAQSLSASCIGWPFSATVYDTSNSLNTFYLCDALAGDTTDQSLMDDKICHIIQYRLVER